MSNGFFLTGNMGDKVVQKEVGRTSHLIRVIEHAGKREPGTPLLADPQQPTQTMLLQTRVGVVPDRGGGIQGHGVNQ